MAVESTCTKLSSYGWADESAPPKGHTRGLILVSGNSFIDLPSLGLNRQEFPARVVTTSWLIGPRRRLGNTKQVAVSPPYITNLSCVFDSGDANIGFSTPLPLCVNDCLGMLCLERKYAPPAWQCLWLRGTPKPFAYGNGGSTHCFGSYGCAKISGRI